LLLILLDNLLYLNWVELTYNIVKWWEFDR